MGGGLGESESDGLVVKLRPSGARVRMVGVYDVC